MYAIACDVTDVNLHNSADGCQLCGELEKVRSLQMVHSLQMNMSRAAVEALRQVHGTQYQYGTIDDLVGT